MIFLVRIMMSVWNSWLLCFNFSLKRHSCCCCTVACCVSGLIVLLALLITWWNVLRGCGHSEMKLPVCLSVYFQGQSRACSTFHSIGAKAEKSLNFYHVAVYVKWRSSKELLYRWFVWAANYKQPLSHRGWKLESWKALDVCFCRDNWGKLIASHAITY